MEVRWGDSKIEINVLRIEEVAEGNLDVVKRSLLSVVI